MVSSQICPGTSPIPGEGNSGGRRSDGGAEATCCDPTQAFAVISQQRGLCPLTCDAGFPFTAASQHSRRELLSGRQNNIRLNCHCFTELVTHQAGVQEEMAF